MNVAFEKTLGRVSLVKVVRSILAEVSFRVLGIGGIYGVGGVVAERTLSRDDWFRRGGKVDVENQGRC